MSVCFLKCAFNSCNLRSDRLEVDRIGVVLSSRQRPVLGQNQDSRTSCHRLCRPVSRKRTTNDMKTQYFKRTLMYGCKTLTLTFTFSLAEVSKNSTPSWSANCFPRSNEITRSSSISHLLPTKITCALSQE